MTTEEMRQVHRLVYSEFRPKRLHFSTGRVQTNREPPLALKAAAIQWLTGLDDPDQFLASLQAQVRQWQRERKYRDPLSVKQMRVLIANYLA